MFKKIIGAMSTRAMRRDLEQYLRHIEEAHDEEAGAMLACAFWMRIALVDWPQNGMPFPDALLDRGPANSQEKVWLMHYNMRLIAVRTSSQRLQEASTPIVTDGLHVWICSIRAITHPELLSIGRKIWRHLLRGMPHWKIAIETFSFVPDVPDKDLVFIPELLRPREH